MNDLSWFGSNANLTVRIALIIAIAILIERGLRFFIGKFMRISAQSIHVDQRQNVNLSPQKN